MGVRYIIVILFGVAMVSCRLNNKEKNIASKIDSYLVELHGKRVFNGAIIVSDNGQIRYSRGFGKANIEANVDFTTNTATDAGSITKTFTSAGIFKLKEENRLKLTDPIIKFFPRLGLTYSEIQIQHLLSHTSGIAGDDYFFSKAPTDSIISNEFFIDILSTEKPKLTFAPGQRFEYSNVNYILLASIIEKTTTKSYEAFMKEQFLEPLNISHAFLRPTLFKDWPSTRTMGYKFSNDTITNDSENFEGFYGCCNLFFSAKDLQKWNQAFINNGPFSDETLEIGLKNYSLSNGKTTMLNLLNWYSSVGSNEHHFTGDWKGFYSMVYRNLSKKRSIVYITNGSMPHWLKSKIVRDINKILDGNASVSIQEPNMNAIPNLDLVLGTYEVEGVQLTISKNELSTYIQIGNDVRYPIHLIASKILYCPGMDAWIWFPKSGDDSLKKIVISNIYRIVERTKK